MFARIAGGERRRVVVSLDGASFEGYQGDSVATVLLLAGKVGCRRSLISRAPRGPYCMMGVCFECLVRVDGVDGLQACMTPIRHGMQIETSIDER